MGDTVFVTAGIVEYSLFEPQRGSGPPPPLVLLQLEKGVGVWVDSSRTLLVSTEYCPWFAL